MILAVITKYRSHSLCPPVGRIAVGARLCGRAGVGIGTPNGMTAPATSTRFSYAGYWLVTFDGGV
jgi:hypothetical protein